MSEMMQVVTVVVTGFVVVFAIVSKVPTSIGMGRFGAHFGGPTKPKKRKAS